MSMAKLLATFTKKARKIREIEEAKVEKEEGKISGFQQDIVNSEEAIEVSKEEIRKADAFIAKFEEL